ncbi:hypothetical protein DYB25_004616 [Aphanomyces astaci]|uniref:Uncharacterized protein n=2 Tax=Aphanomyces astaci TaxID=112090 RepID=A0A397DTI1_APHAT|nr:hypothetical protein DYB36_004061 [Aphanomyces astaci]RHY10095.1 hypothetical protein DYB25_004616 [Aphanomyces astaci]RHY57158.1 hypothetical protein DYB38_011792 [Aphanomyces astaci]RHY68848.1 hypothetical protein DYB34_010283 [Aphanomyces astaci]RHY71024.1 hypothetical protein DYB30_007241 [Aphanomyces astaci]
MWAQWPQRELSSTAAAATSNQVIEVASLLDARVTSVSSSKSESSSRCTIPPRWYKLTRFLMGVTIAGVAVVAGFKIYFMLAPFPRDVVFHPSLNNIVMPVDRVSSLWRPDEFQCLGWRAVEGCDPTGARKPWNDHNCNEPIKRGMAGFCEVRNRTSGEVFRVMATTCRGIDDHHEYTCNMATEFTDFSIKAVNYRHNEPLVVSSLTDAPTRGIAMSVYTPVLASAYAVIRSLRAMKCVLPIELFYHPGEIDLTNPVVVELTGKYNCNLRPILNKAAKKFKSKPYAIYHSAFDQVLFLDSDNFPTRDPTFLFDTPEFLDTGAVFWPDFWQPDYSIFNVNSQSLLWQLLDMAPFGDFEQESGQLLVDRRRAPAALDKLMYYTMEGRLLEKLELVWGDKDLFRFAWHNTSTPFHFIETPPALGGRYDAVDDRFCGVAMMQFDPQGDILFIHRNTYKMTGRQEQVPLLTHMQVFNATTRAAYEVHHTGAGVGLGICWALKDDVPSYVVAMKDTAAAHVESHALHHAMEAGITMGIEPEIVHRVEATSWWRSPLEWLVCIMLWGGVATILLAALHWVSFRSVFGDKKLHWFDRYAGKKRKLSEYPIV